ncbi:MAG: AAA-like domain-containing protein [Blastocatellia bacterium]
MGITARKFFISYSHAEAEERALAKWFHEALVRAGHQSFIDAGIPLGAKWSEEVERNLVACDCFIALLSEAAVKSEMVIEEVRRANSLRRQLIPVLVRFDGDFGYHLGAIINPLQWERWESKKDSEPILKRILHLAGGSATPQPVAQPAKRRAAKSPRKVAPPRPAPMASPVPGGALALTNPFYVKRAIEKSLMKLAAEAGATVTIEAPRQTGKSSLLQRYLAVCQKARQRTVLIDLSRFDTYDFQSYSRLLGAVADTMSRGLGIESGAPAEIAGTRKFCNWVEDRVLKTVEEPVVAAFDEADMVFDHEYCRDFFKMLRSWQNSRVESQFWERFGLAMVISTERNLLIENATASPFNVGLQVLLEPFDLKECLRLNGRFEKLTGKSLAAEEVKQLWELLGGQPYLTHQANYAIVTNRVRDAKKLIADADSDGSPFADHLRALLGRITQRAEFNLAGAFRQILAGSLATDRQAVSRLRAAGLVRLENNRPLPANQLYARFFRRML